MLALEDMGMGRRDREASWRGPTPSVFPAWGLMRGVQGSLLGTPPGTACAAASVGFLENLLCVCSRLTSLQDTVTYTEGLCNT